MPDRMTAWIATQIEARDPSRSQYLPQQAVQSLIDACSFFDGNASLVFGMVAQVDAADAPGLRDACVAALRRWLDHLGRTDDPLQVALYDAMKRQRLLEPDRAEPPLRVRRRSNREALERALQALPTPVEAIARMWPREADSTRELIEWLSNDFEAVARPCLPDDLPMAEEYLQLTSDDWRKTGGSDDPALLSLAWLDDFGIGLYVDVQLVTVGAGIPLVAYDEDGPYRWICEGPSHALAMVCSARGYPDRTGARAASHAARGGEHPAVQSRLARRGARVSRPWTWQSTPEAVAAGLAACRAYEATHDTFAAIHVRAQMLTHRLVMQAFDADVDALTTR